MSQGSEEVVPKNSSKDLTKHWNTLETVHGGDPWLEGECTSDQLTGIDVLLKARHGPMCRFWHMGTEPSQNAEETPEHRLASSYRRSFTTTRNCRTARHPFMDGVLPPSRSGLGGFRDGLPWTSLRLQSSYHGLHEQVRKSHLAPAIPCVFMCRHTSPSLSSGVAVGPVRCKLVCGPLLGLVGSQSLDGAPKQ